MPIEPRIFRITTDAPGALFIMPRPSPEWLAEELGTMRTMGVDRIVSMLGDDEIDELELGAQGDVCTNLGITFTRFPVFDRGLPEPEGFQLIVASVASDLQAGTSVAVHCRTGIGRAGTLAGCVLKTLGMTATDAIAAVQMARGVTIPDTLEQRGFIVAYSH